MEARVPVLARQKKERDFLRQKAKQYQELVTSRKVRHVACVHVITYAGLHLVEAGGRVGRRGGGGGGGSSSLVPRLLPSPCAKGGAWERG